MKRWNHAMTLAFEVHSNDPTAPSVKETFEALEARVRELRADPIEQMDAFSNDLPFDTYENGVWPK